MPWLQYCSVQRKIFFWNIRSYEEKNHFVFALFILFFFWGGCHLNFHVYNLFCIALFVIHNNLNEFYDYYESICPNMY